jgi:hypothetical protein
MFTHLSRREFLRLTAATTALAALPTGILAAGYQYGLVTEPAPGYNPANWNKPAGWFSKGAILRYRVLQDGWLMVIHDADIANFPYPLSSNRIVIPPGIIRPISKEEVAPVPLAPGESRWVEVYRKDQYLRAFSNGAVYLETSVTTGRTGMTTPGGSHPITRGRMSRVMHGDLSPIFGVPHVLYFSGGAALHGAYWHERFGTLPPFTHGCVNVPEEIMAILFGWLLGAIGTTINPLDFVEFKGNPSLKLIHIF